VRVRAASPTALTVTWTPPSNTGGDAVTSYLVEWDTVATFDSSRVLPHRGSQAVTAASATIASLAAGVPYFVRASACNAVGCGGASVDTPAAVAPQAVVPGAPAGLGVAPSATACRTLLISFAQPLVPASGVACGGAAGAPAPCPAGATAALGVADGGARISSFEVHVSAYADFRDVSAGAGGAGVFVIPVAPTADGTAAVQAWPLGPTSGAGALQPGGAYYVRAAARNGQGTGPFCARAGAACDGAVLVATAPAAGPGLACPAV